MKIEVLKSALKKGLFLIVLKEVSKTGLTRKFEIFAPNEFGKYEYLDFEILEKQGYYLTESEKKGYFLISKALNTDASLEIFLNVKNYLFKGENIPDTQKYELIYKNDKFSTIHIIRAIEFLKEKQEFKDFLAEFK